MVSESECAESTSVEAGRKSLEFSPDENKRQSRATDQLESGNRTFVPKSIFYHTYPTIHDVLAGNFIYAKFTNGQNKPTSATNCQFIFRL